MVRLGEKLANHVALTRAHSRGSRLFQLCGGRRF